MICRYCGKEIMTIDTDTFGSLSWVHKNNLWAGCLDKDKFATPIKEKS